MVLRSFTGPLKNRIAMPLLGPEQVKDFGRYGAVGLEMAALVFVGVKIGEWADARFGTDKIFTLVGVLFGIAAGFWSLIKLTRRANRVVAENEAAERSPDDGSTPDPESEKRP
ncbi:MAG: AtpZ/AtpI family protein [Deltaproteobacteria bacterium]|nr:AtpZ/AtpI family protein [Deltaproteobacteria bacterium]